MPCGWSHRQPLLGMSLNFGLPERKQVSSSNSCLYKHFRHTGDLGGPPIEILVPRYQPRGNFARRPVKGDQPGLPRELSSAQAVEVMVIPRSFLDLQVFKTPFQAWRMSHRLRQKSTSHERGWKSPILVFSATFAARGEIHDVSPANQRRPARF